MLRCASNIPVIHGLPMNNVQFGSLPEIQAELFQVRKQQLTETSTFKSR